MDRIWQWAWDRYGARYSWAIYAIDVPRGAADLPASRRFSSSPSRGPSHYVEAATVTVVAVPVMVYVVVLPGVGREPRRGAVGSRRARSIGRRRWRPPTPGRGGRLSGRWRAPPSGSPLLLVVVGAIAGATGSRLVQYGILGAAFGAAVPLIAVHSFVEAAMRPARVAIAGDTGIGDSLPRSRPTFAAWSNVSMLAVAFMFAVAGAMLAAVFDRAVRCPVLAVVIGGALTLGFAVPLTVGARVLTVPATRSRPRRRNRTCCGR